MFFLCIIFINLKLPINDYFSVILTTLTLAFIVLFKAKKNIENIFGIKVFFLLIIITSINLIIPKNIINESHSIFLSKKDIGIINTYLPEKIINQIKRDYKKNFDMERALKSYDSDYFSSEEKLNSYSSIQKFNAFSSDNFFTKSELTRKVNTINFNSRESLRIDQLNTIQYNLVFDKKFRRMLPFYVAYEIPEIAKKSKICTNGNFFYTYADKGNSLKNIKNLNFKKLTKSKCLNFNKNFNNLYLVGYSINLKDNISLKLYKNYKLLFFDTLSKILTILVFFISISIFFDIRKNFKNNLYLFSISLFSLIIFVILKDINMITGLRYFRGGADGLFHASQSYDIIKNLYYSNFIKALRGGEDVYYFMPGLRYYGAINNIFFGATNYGYLLLSLFIPIYLFNLIKNISNLKTANILIISFIFFPILENLGFGYFNYVGQVVRNHAETFSIFLIIVVISIITKFNVIKINQSFFIVLTLAIATFARPNFFPTSLILTAYVLINSIKYRNYYNLFFILFASSFFLLSLFHNIIYGDSLYLFTYSKIHFVFNDLYHTLNISDFKNNFFFSQIIKWNPIYNIHRLIILIIITFYILKRKNSLINITLFCCCISQHMVLLVTHPDSRYAYLAWLLTLLLFIKINYENNIILNFKNKLFK